MNLHIYRTPNGQRLLFREAELAGPPKYLSRFRRVELETVYGSVYTVLTVTPESVIDHEEKEAEPGYYVFHWSPT